MTFKEAFNSVFFLRIAFISMMLLFALTNDVDISIKVNSKNKGTQEQKNVEAIKQGVYHTSNTSNAPEKKQKASTKEEKVSTEKRHRLANPNSDEAQTKIKYIKRFTKTAIQESEKYNIPTSIILAQGVLETKAGTSKLATENNNHFGMKCFKSKCKKGHCSNHSDDTHKDFFVVYKTAWESYRAHSILLNNKRYLHLKNIPLDNYKKWAIGIKKAGYATDPKYSTKLIKIIESFNLDKIQ